MLPFLHKMNRSTWTCMIRRSTQVKEQENTDINVLYEDTQKRKYKEIHTSTHFTRTHFCTHACHGMRHISMQWGNPPILEHYKLTPTSPLKYTITTMYLFRNLDKGLILTERLRKSPPWPVVSSVHFFCPPLKKKWNFVCGCKLNFTAITV